jgi:hypothetical protein
VTGCYTGWSKVVSPARGGNRDELECKKGPRQAERKDRREYLVELLLFITKRWLPTYPASVGNRECTVMEKRWATRDHILPELGLLKLDKIGPERQ